MNHRLSTNVLPPLLLGFLLGGACFAQPVYFGNQATAIAGGLPLMSGPTQSFSCRFTAQQTAPVGEIQVYIGGITGSPQYQASLQGDSGGQPSGIPLAASGTLTPVMGWNDILFTSNANLTAGSVYHIVVQWVGPAGTSTWTKSMSFSISSPHWDGFYPLSQATDAHFAVGFNTGSGWTMATTEKPIFLVNYGGGWDGNPYFRLGFGGEVQSTNLYGQRFQLSNSLAVTSVGSYILEEFAWGGPAQPGDNLYWAVRDLSSGNLVANGTLVTASPATINGWQDAPATFTLAPGTYRFELSSPGSSMISGDIYQADLESPATLMGIYPGLTYGATNAYAEASTDGGLSWAPLDSESDDFPFRFAVTTPAPPTPTPHITPTPVPQCGLSLSQNLFRPSQGTLMISVETACLGADTSLRIYNSAGEHIRTLTFAAGASPALPATAAWDGTNKYGDKCADGVYLIIFQSAGAISKGRVLLVR